MSDSIVHFDGEKWKYSNFHRDHNSSRAILVCGGPSLKNMDRTQFTGPGKVVLGVNNTYPFIKPDMWMGMDDPRCYHRKVHFESFPKFLRGGYQKRHFQNFRPLDLHNTHYINVKRDVKTRIFDRASKHSKAFIWHNNVMAVGMSLLLHMGFKEIYIAGCDLDNTEQDYFDDRKLVGKEKDRNTALYKHLYKWLKWLTPAALDRGIKICSISPNSGINDIMPYISLEELNSKVASDLPQDGPLYNAYTLSQMLQAGKTDIK